MNFTIRLFLPTDWGMVLNNGNHIHFKLIWDKSTTVKGPQLAGEMSEGAGSRASGGKAYRLEQGQSWANTSCSFEKNIEQWKFSFEAKRSTSAHLHCLRILSSISLETVHFRTACLFSCSESLAHAPCAEDTKQRLC